MLLIRPVLSKNDMMFYVIQDFYLLWRSRSVQFYCDNQYMYTPYTEKVRKRAVIEISIQFFILIGNQMINSKYNQLNFKIMWLESIQRRINETKNVNTNFQYQRKYFPIN